jgi:hypothetical protein
VIDCMGKTRNYLTSIIAGAGLGLSAIFSNPADAQSLLDKTIHVKDPILQEGLPGIYAIWHDTILQTVDTFMTNSNGDVTILTVLMQGLPDFTKLDLYIED